MIFSSLGKPSSEIKAKNSINILNIWASEQLEINCAQSWKSK